MSDKTDHPFQPGVRVAQRLFHGDNYAERFVEKVHKSGRFTLKNGGAQQWKPESWWNGDGKPRRHAAQTTSGDHIFLWDDEIDNEIREHAITKAKRERLSAIRKCIAGLHHGDITAEMLDKLEAALPKPEAGKS